MNEWVRVNALSEDREAKRKSRKCFENASRFELWKRSFQAAELCAVASLSWHNTSLQLNYCTFLHKTSKRTKVHTSIQVYDKNPMEHHYWFIQSSIVSQFNLSSNKNEQKTRLNKKQNVKRNAFMFQTRGSLPFLQQPDKIYLSATTWQSSFTKWHWKIFFFFKWRGKNI